MPELRGKFGLPKRERILKSRRFKWVLRRGRRYYTPNFTLIFHESEDHSRIGLTVSRKVGNAVERNHVKRRLRECYRLHKDRLKAPCYLVVIARPGAASLSYHAICRELVPSLEGASGSGRDARPPRSAHGPRRDQRRRGEKRDSA